jgi:serine/threonine protein kinase/tetratricopeptide (TPR) repeat protein
MSVQTRAPSWAEIDPTIAAFESAWAGGGDVSLSAHVPDDTHPHFLVILCELVRVDLEFGWSAGRPRPLAEYFDAYPVLAADDECRAQITFEEYRLRQQAGESPGREDYAGRFAVDTSDWPPPRQPATGRPGSTINTRAEQGSAPTVVAPPRGGPVPVTAEAIRSHGDSVPDLADRLAQILTALQEPRVEVPGFRILRELGRGAFGRVYLARQEDLANRDVVLKLTGDPRGEPQTLARLQHTNIVPIYSVHRAGLLSAFCMPYFGATTFATLLDALRGRSAVPTTGAWLTDHLPAVPNGPARGRQELEGRSHVAAVLWLGARLAEGLAHAHENGIVHQDLKPANLLLSDSGEPMLLDFNLARDPAIVGRAPMTYIGGTLPYMSPERLAAFAEGRQHTDPRDDLYALGLILHDLLTGATRVPVPSGHDLAEVLRQLSDDRRRFPPDPRVSNPSVRPAVAAILARCLAPDPARRYQSARELAEDISRHLDDRPLVHAPNTTREQFAKWRRRHPRLTSVSTTAAVAIVLLVTAIGVAIQKDRELVRSQAVNTLQEFRDELSASRLLIRAPAPSRRDVDRGLSVARRAAARYGLDEQSDPDEVLSAPRLDADARVALREELAELATLLSRGEEFYARLAPAESVRGERFEQAVRFDELAERFSRDHELVILCRRHRADLLAALGRVDEARALLAEAPFVRPLTERSLRTLAGEHMSRGEYAEAAESLKRANRTDPQNPLGLMLLGYCYERQKNFPKAVGCYDAVLALTPGSQAAHYRRAAALAEFGEHADAIEDYSAALVARDDDFATYLDRARSYAALGDYKSAIADLDRVLGCAGAPTETFFLRAKFRAARGDRAGAEADRKEGLVREPNDERGWLARGVARAATDPTGALADFEQARRLNPRSLDAWENRASVLSENLNRPRDALKALDAALDLDPKYVSALLGRAVLRARAGLRTESHKDARTALKLSVAPSDQYQAACVFALTAAAAEEDQAEALYLLESALRGGYNPDELAGDRDLDPIRNSRGFQELVKRFAPARAKRK